MSMLRLLRRRTLSIALLLVMAMVISPVQGLAQGDDSSSLGSVSVAVPADEEPLFNLFFQVKGLLENYHPASVGDKVLYTGAIKGMVEALGDPYSTYMDETQTASFSQSLEGDYTGVGVTITLRDSKITVVSVFPGSPAQRAGMKAGDVITAAGGVDLRGKTSEDASNILRGVAGEPVTIRFERPSTGESFEATLVREIISRPSMDGRFLTDEVYLVKITEFTRNTARDFSAVMDFLRCRNVKGLVLDLRDNPGGLIDSCVEVASELVPEGPIVTLRRGELSIPYNTTKNTVPIPVVVLVNGGTASAAEIVAAAVRDRGIGVLVGEMTFGKGSVQSVVDLGELGGIRLTIANYYTPSGISISGTGLIPDRVIVPEDVVLPTAVQYKRPLTQGVVGLDVLAVQEQLEFLGYEFGEPDGVFGPATSRALAAFLKSEGLPQSGSVTEETVAALEEAVLEKVAAIPDVVLEEGLQILKDKLMTGFWRNFDD
jgi:carboxyl-terminal processing protease